MNLNWSSHGVNPPSVVFILNFLIKRLREKRVPEKKLKITCSPLPLRQNTTNAFFSKKKCAAAVVLFDKSSRQEGRSFDISLLFWRAQRRSDHPSVYTLFM